MSRHAISEPDPSKYDDQDHAGADYRERRRDEFVEACQGLQPSVSIEHDVQRFIADYVTEFGWPETLRAFAVALESAKTGAAA